MRKKLFLLLAGLLVILFGCGVADDFKYMEERELIIKLLAPSKHMPYTENIPLYGGVAFHSELSHLGQPWWFVRDGKVYALNEDAQEITPSALPRISSVVEALLPSSIEKTRKNPPVIPKKHLSPELYDYYTSIKSRVEPLGATVEGYMAYTKVLDKDRVKAEYFIYEEGGYITKINLSCYLTQDEGEHKAGGNTIPVTFLLQALLSVTGSEQEVDKISDTLIEPVLIREKEEVIEEINGLKFRVSSLDYSKVSRSEVPDYLEHIKKPAALFIEIMLP